MAEFPKPPNFAAPFQRPRRRQLSWLMILVLIVGAVVAILSYLVFSRPETVPSAALFEKLFPRGTAIQELGRINIDVDGIRQNPIFRTLEEHVPLPLEVPPTGKANPFI
ncbi:MAG: hypothetical protein HYW80_01395 [Parcubacteria group bacterium]|nr:hypothetical protein [Parcubacteria group bacterium]